MKPDNLFRSLQDAATVPILSHSSLVHAFPFCVFKAYPTSTCFFHICSSLPLCEFILCSFAYLFGATRIKIDHLDPSMDRSIRTVWQLKQVFRPCCMMFKEAVTIKVFWQRKENTNQTLKHSFCWGWGVRSVTCRFLLFTGGLGT